MWKYSVLFLLLVLGCLSCQKDRFRPFFKLEFEDGLIVTGKPWSIYIYRPDRPCYPDTCFSINMFGVNGPVASNLLIANIPLKEGVFKFHQLRPAVPPEERGLYSIEFYPRDPTIHKNDPNAWNHYVAIEDDFNEFVITCLDLYTGKVEGHFRVNLVKFPAGYIYTGGWPSNFVSDTIQIVKGTFLSEIVWH